MVEDSHIIDEFKPSLGQHILETKASNAKDWSFKIQRMQIVDSSRCRIDKIVFLVK